MGMRGTAVRFCGLGHDPINRSGNGVMPGTQQTLQRAHGGHVSRATVQLWGCLTLGMPFTLSGSHFPCLEAADNES